MLISFFFLFFIPFLEERFAIRFDRVFVYIVFDLRYT